MCPKMQAKLSACQREMRTLQERNTQLKQDLTAADREAKHCRWLVKAVLASQAAGPSPRQAVLEQQRGTTSNEIALQEDKEAKERLDRIEAGMIELLAWKNGAARGAQGVTNRQDGSRDSACEGGPAPSPSHTQATHEPAPETCAHMPQTSAAPQFPAAAKNACDALMQPPSKDSARKDSIARGAQTDPCPSPYCSPGAAQQEMPAAIRHSPGLGSAAQMQESGVKPARTPVTPQLDVATPAQMSSFLKDHPHEAVGHVRPGVVSRFPHRLEALHAMRAELQAELAAELDGHLAQHGVPAEAQGLSPAQFLACMDSIRQRRADAVAQMGEKDREREEYMRNTLRWHVDSVAQAVGDPRAVAHRRHAVHGARECGEGRSRAEQGWGTPGSQQTLNSDEIEADVFYSPLRRGTTETWPQVQAWH